MTWLAAHQPPNWHTFPTREAAETWAAAQLTPEQPTAYIIKEEDQ